jgi:2-dehydro-3-deoxyphosphooctonate aldolase (KDO 8-P synthase)
MIENVRKFKISNFYAGGKEPLFLLAGPCIAESRDLLFEVGTEMKSICQRLGISYVFKTSFDKANRSSVHSYRGPGMAMALGWLQELKDRLSVPVVVDVHEPAQCAAVAEVADILQIPAFLCRQTDLIQAAAVTGRVVNVKKGQFLSPAEVKNIVSKLEESGNENILITERGASFGYNNLVVDPRSFQIIRSFGVPVVFDATHSVQLPGAQGSITGGQREFIPVLARAAVAAGIDGLFMEVHPEPDKGLSDPATMLSLDKVEKLLMSLQKIDQVVKNGVDFD